MNIQEEKSPNQKFTVLVIDDQKNWRELLVEILQEQFEVTSANSYDDALEKIYAQKSPFHVVVTDMRLVDEENGNEDGLKLIEHLNRRGDETKTIVITGYATVDTTKRAFSKLFAYDYFEKYPANGSRFDAKKFETTVYQAAIEAEKQRPDGGTNIQPDILLLEVDPVLRKKLKQSISDNGYNIYTPDLETNLNKYLKNNQHKYALIIFGEALLDENLLENLYLLHPDARMIMLTSQNISPILKAMRNYPVISAFDLQTPSFNSGAFQELVHNALAPGAIKHISVKLEDNGHLISANKLSQHNLLLGKTYKIKFSLQDFAQNETTPIWLSPQGEKKGKIQLHLFIHTTEILLHNGSDLYWNISLSTPRPSSFEILITPQAVGQHQITIEIDQNYRWLARIILSAMVSAD